MTASEPLELSATSLDAFLAKNVEDPDFGAAVADRAQMTSTAAAEMLRNLASEARLARDLLASLQPTRAHRILEVGAGAGVFAAFLVQQGADLLAIEPIVGGFEFFMAVRSLLGERTSVPAIEPLFAEELNVAEHGRFDLIVSVNVVEHMRPLHRNLDALAAVLAPGGRMIHTCPNYRIPYEPHYQLPLVPGRPGLTRLVARQAGREPLWKSLNWITARDVRRFARRHDLGVEFTQGELARSLARLSSDPSFARRQRGPVIRIVRALDKVGVTRLLTRIPATWMTPMTFTVVRPGTSRPNP